MTRPKFNIEDIVSTYTPPNGNCVRRVQNLLKDHAFTDAPDVTVLIGLGGTISSAYSYNQETIVVGPYQVAARIITSLQEKFAINRDPFTVIDLFAKDSRDIKNDDLILLLDTLHVIQNKYVLITCGTYMLPRIAELLFHIMAESGKIIGLTGAMLPLGFMDSDAPQNVLSTMTALNVWKTLKSSRSCVFVCFHGHVYHDLHSLRDLNLHPRDEHDTLIAYPMTTVPVDTKK